MGTLETVCPGGLDWAFYGLGECIRTSLEKASLAFGILSIASWFCFGFPQIIKNIRIGIPDEAVSPYLLFFWLAGDSSNFIGAFLTNQLFFQKLLAGYTICIDLILIAQYFFYYFRNKRRHKRAFEETEGDDSSVGKSELNEDGVMGTKKKATLALLFIGVVGLTNIHLGDSQTMRLMLPQMQSKMMAHSFHSTGIGARRLLETVTTQSPGGDSFLNETSEVIGYVLGWISAVMCFCSRMPQIFQNFRRKSTEGLSVFLFVLAVSGNTCYGLQIFLRSIEPMYLLNSAPWIVGSIGLLFFDFTILSQFAFYKGRKGKRRDGPSELSCESSSGASVFSL